MAAQAQSKRAGLAPLRSKAEARPGVHALARATALTATHVAVRLDKKSAPISPLYLLYISLYLPISPPHLAHISPTSRPYLPHISPTSRPYLQVRLDKKNAVRGVVHLTELAEPGQDAKLPTSLPQGPLHVVVLTPAAGTKAPLQLTMRPSALAAEGSAPPPPRLTSADLAPGQSVPGWVAEATPTALRVSLSAACSGSVAALEASADAAVLAHLPAP